MTFAERLRHDLEQASATIPRAGIDFAATIDRGRSIRRRSMLIAGAATATVVLAVAGATVALPDRNPSPQPPGGESPSPHVTESQVPPPPAIRRAEAVLREWLDAIQEGNANRVWSMLTPEAREIVGRERFDQMMASALPEGLGAFADATQHSHVVVERDGTRAAVVGIVSGEITREAETAFAAMAIPMRIEDDEVLVDDGIIDRARYYERVAVFASESLGPQKYHSGERLVVELTRPEGAVAASISIDDDVRPLKTDFDPASGRVEGVLDRDLAAGRHIATLIVVTASGRLYPEAIVFEAGSP